MEPAVSGIALGNLEALADAISAQVGGAVTIEDVQSRVLAYSSSEDAVDDIRKLTILGRRVPQWRISAMEESGFFRALWASGDVVHRSASDDEPERFAIAVKAGTEILGSIWVATSGTPGHDMVEVLRNCAAAAVSHLLFYRSLHSGLALQVDTAARDLLKGHGSADLLAERAGLSAALPAIVLVIRSDDPRRMDINPRVPELVTLKSSLQGGRPVVVPREGSLWVILTGFRTPEEAQARARTVAESLVEPLDSMLPGRTWISVGTAVSSLHGVRDSLRSAELALRALKFSPAAGTVGSAPDLGNEMALVQLGDSLAGADFSRPTPVDRLVNHDGERGDTALVDTLRAYLDAFGNIPKAARQLGYHPNSFRYRLRKMEEISGIKLEDPDARLLAQIQLRLLPGVGDGQRNG
ncbi:PucR family transcriptional regulator [Arthrobacter sp. 2MCAF15]|uniref:PucR family transcriptional regulator n=1 Tax=Arthrobacter sp. 2MCAF15 TaxID=3232984 RepID=UPI003F8DD21C